MIFLFLVFSFSFLFSFHDPVLLFKYNGEACFDTDFYTEIGKRNWDSFDSNKKRAVFNDFLKKELGVLEAEKKGLHLLPSFIKKFKQRERQFLINNTYEHLIARPLISDNIIDLNLKNLKTSVKVWHFLISIENKEDSGKGKKEGLDRALLFRKNIVDSVDNGGVLKDVFSFFASKHSYDPSAKSNGGFLGWVDWGSTVSAFQNPVFLLQKGELSVPILTDYGYHLVFVEDFGLSDYYFYKKPFYKDLAYKVGMRSLSFDSLRQLSSSFDSLTVLESGADIETSFSKKVFDYIFLKKEKERLVSSKYSLLDWLDVFKESGVLLTYNDKKYGLNWLVNKIKNLPSTRIPVFVDYSSFLSFINSLVLEEEVLSIAFNKKINQKTSFIRDMGSHYKNILYNDFLSGLVDKVSVDSSAVVSSYNKGVYRGDFINPRRVVVSEINFSSFKEAQTALEKIKKGMAFDVAVDFYKGKTREPFPVGRGGFVGEAAFLLNKGDLSGIIENANGSFSVFRVEDFLEEEPFTLKAVYKQIERKLIKEKQKEIKNSFLSLLIKNNNVVVNYEGVGL